MFKHELGLIARDPISGVEGIIVARAHHLFGCNSYGLAQVKRPDGTVPKTEYFDEDRIEITGKGEAKIQINEFDEIFMHPAGKTARDKVTGFVGTIVYRMEYLHGSNQYALSPKVDGEGKLRDMEQFDEGRIEIIDDGIKPEDVQGPKRGGINRDAPRW